MTWEARHVSVAIDREPAAVVAYADDSVNLPLWADDLGVLDHDVRLPDGDVVHNPLRVLADTGGSEIVFTLFRLDPTDENAFEADAAAVQADLERVKRFLED